LKHFHALEIFTNGGNGDVIPYSNAAVGAVDGVIALISGRPGLDGSKAVAGDTARTIWFQDILTLEGAKISVTRVADFVEVGGMASTSPPAFALKNATGIRATLRAAGIYLERCRVVYYFVETADEVTYTFYRRGTWVIDDQPFSATAYAFKCVDNSKDVFGNLPSVPADPGNYGQAAEGSQDKMLPIALGRVPYSPLVNVRAAGEDTALTHIGGVDGYVCAAKEANTTGKWLDLFTEGKSFPANAVGLVGRFLAVIAGGAEQSIKVKANDASNATSQTTRVYLDALWEGVFTKWESGVASQSVWYFQVRRYTADFITSTKPVFQQLKNDNGQTALYAYDSTLKRFSDISELKTLSSETALKEYGRPGVEAILKRFETDGNISVFTPIKPSTIVLHQDPYYLPGTYPGRTVTWSGPGVGEEQPSLSDQDRVSGYTLAGDHGVYELVFDLNFPEGEIKKNYDDVYLLLDFRHRRTVPAHSGNLLVNVQASATGIDIHGQETTEVISPTNLFEIGVDEPLGTDWVEIFTLPGVYYGTKEDPDGFYTERQSLSISSLIANSNKFKAYPKMRVRVRSTFADFANYEMELYEIGFVGKKSLSIASDEIYHSLKGETFGTEWRAPEAPGTGRYNAIAAIDNIAHGLEHPVRNYDYGHPIWLANNAYKVGEKVRSVLDNGYIYICTVAGTSGASQPAFPVTLGATVTDGGVTWKALDTLKIDCASFDVLNFQRQGWFIGRTLTKSRPSLEWYKEMARCGFFGMFMDDDGRLSVSAWRENREPVITFSSEPGGNIIEGTLQGEMKPSPMRRCYNDFLVRYGENPATGSLTKQIGITHTDQPEFPGPTETVIPGTVIPDLQNIYVLSNSDGTYRFYFIFNAGHGRTTGDFVSVTGADYGFDHPPRQVSVTNATDFYVDGHATSAVASFGTGTVRHHTDTRLKWKSFAPGFANYAKGKQLWEVGRSAFIVSKTVQKMPQDLGDCPWFPDPEATDPSGNRLWPDLAGGDDHPAAYFLEQAVQWMGFPKYFTPPFEVEKTAAHLALKLYQPANFLDAKHTQGAPALGWISEITDLPAEGKDKPERLRIVLLMEPEEITNLTVIDENGALASDIIDENEAASTDIIDENGA
jgi:hypothetical protein